MFLQCLLAELPRTNCWTIAEHGQATGPQRVQRLLSSAVWDAIDRALYLPRAWTDDPDRCPAAGVPDDVALTTKPGLARKMITRALDAGTPANWVAGDEVYGNDQACAPRSPARVWGSSWPWPK